MMLQLFSIKHLSTSVLRRFSINFCRFFFDTKLTGFGTNNDNRQINVNGESVYLLLNGKGNVLVDKIKITEQEGNWQCTMINLQCLIKRSVYPTYVK